MSMNARSAGTFGAAAMVVALEDVTAEIERLNEVHSIKLESTVITVTKDSDHAYKLLNAKSIMQADTIKTLTNTQRDSERNIIKLENTIEQLREYIREKEL